MNHRFYSRVMLSALLILSASSCNAGVSEVTVFPDRIELLANGERKAFAFATMAKWPRPAIVWRTLHKLGTRTRSLPPVGERDWFHPPAERFIRFFTDPPIVIYMPDEPRDTEYGSTTFRRVQHVLQIGGFATWDLG